MLCAQDVDEADRWLKVATEFRIDGRMASTGRCPREFLGDGTCGAWSLDVPRVASHVHWAWDKHGVTNAVSRGVDQMSQPKRTRKHPTRLFMVESG